MKIVSGIVQEKPQDNGRIQKEEKWTHYRGSLNNQPATTVTAASLDNQNRSP